MTPTAGLSEQGCQNRAAPSCCPCRQQCSGLWDCSIPWISLWGPIPPCSDPRLICVTSGSTTAPSTGPWSWLSFYFGGLFAAICRADSPHLRGRSTFPPHGPTLPCLAGWQQQPVLPHCSSWLPFRRADPSESGGCIFARVNKSQWYSLHMSCIKHVCWLPTY